MKKGIRRNCTATLIFVLVAIAALIGWMRYHPGVTEVDLLNATGKTVRYHVWEKSSGWSQSGELQPDKSVHMIITPKQAGALRVRIDGDEISLEDQLYIERAREESFSGVIGMDKVTWK